MNKRAPKAPSEGASFDRTKELVVKAAHHTSVPIPWTPLAPSSQSLACWWHSSFWDRYPNVCFETQ